jgi:hypothetical protein
VKVVAAALGEDRGERPDLAADGAERGAAVQDRVASGTFIVDEAVGVAVSHPVTSRTVGRVGGRGAAVCAVCALRRGCR